MLRASFLFSRAALAALPIAALALAAPAANAQADFTFTGGNGNPLTLTLNSPVTYTVTSTPTELSPAFVFYAMGNVDISSLTGTISFSINGGDSIAIDLWGSIDEEDNGVPIEYNDVTPNDAVMFSTLMFSPELLGVSLGDTVVLNAGTLTTTTPYNRAAPASGSFTTFLVQSDNSRISSNGVSVAAAAPEPGSIALLLTASVPVAGIVRRRKKN